MKTIPNVSFPIKISDKPYSTAADILSACLANTPAGGFDFATMRARNRVADALEKIGLGDEITLEDADYSVAVEAIRAMKWGVSHREILKFGELFGL